MDGHVGCDGTERQRNEEKDTRPTNTNPQVGTTMPKDQNTHTTLRRPTWSQVFRSTLQTNKCGESMRPRWNKDEVQTIETLDGNHSHTDRTKS